MVSSSFGGSPKCAACRKSVFFNDAQLSLNSHLYHSTCARCAVCDKKLTVRNMATSGDRILCQTHFHAEFAQAGGKYAGDEKFVKRTTTTVGVKSM